MRKVWDILNKFKRLCRAHGWKTSDDQDWVEVGDDYHSFLWTRQISFASFRRILAERKLAVKTGLSYRVVEPSYMAWLFSERPPEEAVRMIAENAHLSERVALFDLSCLSERSNLCSKLNDTSSPVFQEFENFLRKEFKAKLTRIDASSSNATLGSKSPIAEAA